VNPRYLGAYGAGEYLAVAELLDDVCQRQRARPFIKVEHTAKQRQSLPCGARDAHCATCDGV
jgi:hypothetical protein